MLSHEQLDWWVDARLMVTHHRCNVRQGSTPFDAAVFVGSCRASERPGVDPQLTAGFRVDIVGARREADVGASTPLEDPWTRVATAGVWA